jgi:hypothetical protein
MKLIKRLALFLSLFLLYFIAKEFLELYTYLHTLHPWAGYGFLIALAGMLVWCILLPLIQLWRIPRFSGPPSDPVQEAAFIAARMERLQHNPHLQDAGLDLAALPRDADGYKQMMAPLARQCSSLRDRHIAQMFYATAIAQNGFLDALLIVGISIRHVKEIFELYNGRASNRDLWNIAKLVYLSAVIGGSEGVEYSTNELLGKFSSESLKAIPFFDKVITSLADGLVNAALLTRISYLTQRYCTLTLARSPRDFAPNPTVVFQSVRHITSDIIGRIYDALRKSAMDKTRDVAAIAINPIGYFWSRAIDQQDALDDQQRQQRKEIARLIGNPLAFGLEKLIGSLKR